MPILRNNAPKTPLGLPGVGTINPGASAACSQDAWERLKTNKVVVAWRKVGLLSVEGEVPAAIDAQASGVSSPPPVGHADVASDEAADLNDEKDMVIAELAKYGIEKDRRSSLPTLWALLDEAKKARGAA
jgi:hypothetical protein